MTSRFIWVVSLLIASSGCAATMAEPDLCIRAEAHVQSCGGMQDGDVFVASTCDPEAAEAILDQPCEALADPGKADFFGRFLCRLGVLRYCTVSVCETPGTFDAADPASCGQLIDLEGCGQCDYYRCREQRSTSRCGEEGYYLGFGERYCQRFEDVTEDRLSIAGQAWSQRVRPCLMRALEENASDDLSCDEAHQLAFDSHPGCYVEAGFCALPISDWILVLNTIDAADTDLRQIVMTGVHCLADALTPGGELAATR